VYHCSYDMLGSTRRAAEWVDHHSPVRTRFIKYVQAHPTRRLALGTNTLVVGPQNPITRTTLLALYVPPSTNGFWEFAPCGRTNLMEVTAEDLRITFVGLGDPSGSASFGNDWASTAVRVREGEILFARRVGRAGPVYVIWFTRVSADEYAIQYAVVPINKAANTMKRTGTGPPGPFQSLAQRRPVVSASCWPSGPVWLALVTIKQRGCLIGYARNQSRRFHID